MGVKSLWKLLYPVGRPVMLETMEGQIMAIDSSIWIYQFQATMRDNDGRALSNAHVLGFLRRIIKLLFHGIKPVFVFDGGAPALKRNTLNERRKKKSGAATSHVKLAEKLLAAQLRRAALNQTKGAQKPTKRKGKAPTGPVVLDDNTVYLEDIDSSMPKTPARTQTLPPSSASPSKPKFHDHDPYHLPDLDFDAAVAKATRAPVPDPRLATEEELRAFIEDMRPEDFDSRQTSYVRLQNMLKKASTPLDFSKQQIQNLRQRNTLTQQLLSTTDSIGKANLTIPIRVASERNREYVLIKNEGKDGGWILGIRDDGTREKPIEIDQDNDRELEDDDDSDEDMEEVYIPQPGLPDADLREYQRSMALSAIAGRRAPTKPPKKHSATVPSQPLFDVDDNDTFVLPADDDDDEELAFAIQQSIDQANASKVSSDTLARTRRPPMVNAVASSSKLVDTTPGWSSDAVHRYNDHSDGFYINGNRLETALSIANAGLVRTPAKPSTSMSSKSIFGEPLLLQSTSTPPAARPPPKPPSTSSMFGEPLLLQSSAGRTPLTTSSSSIFGEPVLLQSPAASPTKTSVSFSQPPPKPPSTSSISMFGESLLHHSSASVSAARTPLTTSSSSIFGEPVLLQSPAASPTKTSVSFSSSVFGEPVLLQTMNTPPKPPSTSSGSLAGEPTLLEPMSHTRTELPSNSVFGEPVLPYTKATSPGPRSPPTAKAQPEVDSDEDMEEVLEETTSSAVPRPSEGIDTSVRPSELTPQHNGTPSSGMAVTLPSVPTTPEPTMRSDVEDGDPVSDWSRSPSPIVGLEQPEPRSASPIAENWDAAQEMDPEVEEGEFARFISQVKGKDLDDVRREIDDEIKVLNAQKKAAMRDSEDINQQMISQIMMLLSLFGIPYITAPMEAEAQCATLVSLGLANGVITDDSDVFLFGSQRVFKNMFNQSKTVECFLLSDLSRELGLDRDRLIRLAYLLGSDYVDGLPGVGPVVAMELLDEFPGEDGLHKFKDWWLKVQSGKDKPEDNKSKFRRRFKKKFKDLYLPSEWPNPTVRDAYYHPTVDDSEEPFKWGLPDLDALREFLYAELGWHSDKVDETLLPIIQKIRKRGQAGALNKQGDLNGFFDVSGSGTAVPRKRQAYTSKRLQQVVSDFRKKRKRGSHSPTEDVNSQSESDEDVPREKKAKGTSPKARAVKRGTSRGRGRGGKKRSSRAKAASSGDEAEFEGGEVAPDQLAAQLRPRPKAAYKGAVTK
ncbi:PIN domain-like protein [Mycena rebaudengoi]|nr:PIN domain-like protein [Mycena rebaudengoi]